MHGVGQQCIDMFIDLHHMAFVKRTSGYNTFMNYNLYVTSNSDVKTALKELNILL